MNLFKTVIFISFLLIAVSGHSQSDSAKIEQLNRRVQELEQAENHRQRMLEAHKIELKKDVEETVNEETKPLRDGLHLIGFIGLPGALCAVLIALWGTYKSSKKYLEELTTKKIDRKWQTLQSIMDNYDNDDRLRDQKEILFLSMNNADNTAIRNLVTNLGFKRATFEIITGPINPRNVNLVVFNNKTQQFTQPQISQIVAAWPGTVHYIVYGSAHIQPVPDRTNFASSDFTLFNNALVTLKYAEIINGTRP